MKTLALVSCVAIVFAASPNPPRRTQDGLNGARRLASAVDCSGAVAFSGAGTRTIHAGGLVSYRTVLNDRGVGWSLETGEFTCHCPGLYQFSFAGYGDSPNTRLTMKKRLANATDWTGVVSAGGRASGGGSNTALLDMEVGDQAAVWLDSGNLVTDDDRQSPSTSFSGFRIIKK